MAFYNNVIAGAAGAGGAGAYTIERSLRFSSADSANLARTPQNNSDRRTFTWSGWYKPSVSGGNFRRLFGCGDTYLIHSGTGGTNAADTLYVNLRGASTNYPVSYEPVFRDFSAWYHIVWAVDTTQATAADRNKIYVNGVQLTAAGAGGQTYPPRHNQTAVNTKSAHYISQSNGYVDGLMADIQFVDGAALAPTDFGELDADTGAWNPIKYTRTGPNDGSTYISSSTLNSGNRGAGAGDSAIFSGTVPTGYSVGGSFGGTAVDPSTTSSSLTINLSKSVSGRVSIYPYYAASAANCSIVFSNGNTVTLSGSELYFGAVDLGVQSSFNSFTINQSFITGGGSNFAIGGIAIDGVLLRDSSSVNTGLNDFHLKFDDNSSNAALGTDSSGNNNTWTVANLVAQGAGPGSFTLFGNLSNSGSSSSQNVSNLAAITTTPASSWTADGNTYNHMTADFQSVGSWSINADPFLSSSTANIVVFQSNDGTNWTQISKGQSPYSFSGRYIQWVRSGSGYGGQNFSSPSTAAEQDSLLDSPTNYQASSGNNGGNYCTLNPLDRDRNGKVTITNGNLEATGTSNQYGFVRGTLAPASGKFYYEVTTNGAQGGGYGLVEATAPDQVSGSNPDYTITTAYRNYVYLYNGFHVVIDGVTAYTGSSVSNGDVVGVAVDVDAGKVWFSHNGVWQGSGTQNPATGAGGYSPTHLETACPLFQDGAGSPVPTGKFNFGQRAFIYTVPTNFKSFCTQNLDDPLIANPSTAFQTKLWSGTQAARSITTTGMSPDFVWIKGRSHATWHEAFDSVRGPGLRVFPNDVAVEATNTNTLTAFNSDGFSLLGDAGVNGASNRTYVGWAWEGGNLATLSSQEQSQTWTNGTASGASPYGQSAWAHMFDGVVPSTFAHANLVYLTGSGTFTFPSAISGRIQVYAAQGSSTAYSNNSLELSDGSTINVTNGNASFTLYDFGTKSNITSITVNGANTSSGVGVPAILLDGKMLVNPGTITVGSLNSSVYDQTQTWSTYGTFQNKYTGSGNAYLWDDVFNTIDVNNGDGSLYVNDTSLDKWTLTSSQAVSSTVKIFVEQDNAKLVINAGLSDETTVTSTQTGYHYLTASFSGNVSSISVGPVNSGDAIYVMGIWFDDVRLVDDTETVPNVPSSPSTCRTNRTAGFSIVKYAPNGNVQTIAHNLNQKPELIIVKNLDHAYNWYVYHKALDSSAPEDKFVVLNDTHTTQDSANAWNDTAPTSSVFTVNGGNTAYQYADHIAYCFNSVKSYSQVGKYIGGGSTYPFVHLGFKPAWVMIKNVTTSGSHYDWVIVDSARNPVNKGADNVDSKSFLYANLADVEDKNYTDWLQIDFLSNGFRVNEQSVSINASGSEFIYVAFAQNPFKYARAF